MKKRKEKTRREEKRKEKRRKKKRKCKIWRLKMRKRKQNNERQLKTIERQVNDKRTAGGQERPKVNKAFDMYVTKNLVPMLLLFIMYLIIL